MYSLFIAWWTKWKGSSLFFPPDLRLAGKREDQSGLEEDHTNSVEWTHLTNPDNRKEEEKTEKNTFAISEQGFMASSSFMGLHVCLVGKTKRKFLLLLLFFFFFACVITWGRFSTSFLFSCVFLLVQNPPQSSEWKKGAQLRMEKPYFVL